MPHLALQSPTATLGAETEPSEMAAAVQAAGLALVWMTFALLLAVYVAERRRRGERRGALSHLLLGQLCWCIEVAHRQLVGEFDPSDPAQLADALPYFVLNAAVAGFFFSCGHALLGMKSRMHPVLEEGAWYPEMPFAHALERFGGQRVPGWLVGGVAALGAAAGAALVLIAPGRLVLVELPGAALSFVAMAVLGLGILRDLARRRLDFVSAVCGGSLLAYSVVQLGRLTPSLAAPVHVAALVLKVTYLIALGAYWTLVREMARARNSERSKNEAMMNRVQAIQDDLHDHALGKLSAARRWIELARDNDGDPSTDIRRAHTAIVEAMRNVDRVARMELVIDDLPRAIADLCESLASDRSFLEIDHDVRLDRPLDGALAHAILAIASTALDNVRQHSGARRTKVTLRQREHEVELTVEDDGHGFDATNRSRWRTGLHSIERRLSEFGGDLDVVSHRHGTTLGARFPCR